MTPESCTDGAGGRRASALTSRKNVAPHDGFDDFFSVSSLVLVVVLVAMRFGRLPSDENGVFFAGMFGVGASAWAAFARMLFMGALVMRVFVVGFRVRRIRCAAADAHFDRGPKPARRARRGSRSPLHAPHGHVHVNDRGTSS